MTPRHFSWFHITNDFFSHKIDLEKICLTFVLIWFFFWTKNRKLLIKKYIYIYKIYKKILFVLILEIPKLFNKKFVKTALSKQYKFPLLRETLIANPDNVGDMNNIPSLGKPICYAVHNQWLHCLHDMNYIPSLGKPISYALHYNQWLQRLCNMNEV